jgi:hypothetical protein
MAKAAQYTIRNVPGSVDRALRRKAAARKVSLNSLVLEALEVAAGVSAGSKKHHDLDSFFGTWVADRNIDRALAEPREVDPRDWE